MDYQTAIRETWRHSDLSRGVVERELVRYATLAASSHNTQPWRFRLEPGKISILPDFTRRCPAVDPDDHHLFASLGCALENLILSAGAAGLHGHVQAGSESLPDDVIAVTFEKQSPVRTPLFEAVIRRQCSRTRYDGRPVSTEQSRLLEKAGQGNGVAVLILTGAGQKESVAEYVAQGNVAQLGDREWVNELKSWIRFNKREALATRDGLYARSFGNPEAPRLIGSMFMRLALSPKSQNGKDIDNIRSSAGIAVFVSESDDKKHWIEAGRCYERFALQATVLGIQTAFVNQPVEVGSLRPQFVGWLGVGSRRPDLVVRFGHGPEMPRSLRRPVEQLIE
jgi:hypothetical protein